ncbi:exodeoxyribonuclease VII small subunit [Rhodobacter sp. TJ_12]|uniref:exodeoxyribonuclease VII small subunit n=1 Tax=Rhodobacter sp. TJ_12 TaxID=2029399 RepID=UPI001CBDB62B|nr:exodeoxyribonuclease VII small subunit [Rhodobacter sp. TJ_12]MBZ4023681.1 exodeoxyribonuclease VII small subunit [Rhodobacter sp. TJ_12]
MAEIEIADMTFEQAMAALEQVVNQLERGEVALDQSIQLSERGALLKERCAKLLKEAEERVEKITLGEGGVPKGTQPVEGL